MKTTTEPCIWEKYVPKETWLYYVGYDDTLNNSKDLLQKCLQDNNLFPISERIFDRYTFPEEHELDEVRKKMVADNLGSEFEENEDNIRDYLVYADKSEPEKDLLNNTGGFAAYYSLGKRIAGMGEYDETFEMRSKRGAQTLEGLLGVTENAESMETLYAIVDNATYGGDVRIYFNVRDIRDYISGDKWCEKDGKNDFKDITFKGRFMVAVYDAYNGSGYYEDMKLDLELPFVRDNLIISEVEKYSIENCFGMYDSWVQDTDLPVLSENEPKAKTMLSRSSSADAIKREAELTRIFKQGGCTCGDMDMSRHRDVYYRNDYPCGNKCPHCGTFWID